MDIDFSHFSREDFKITGFRRGIVEDNNDPTNSGRVRVRIIGIHSLDGEETPTSHLPWAEPCLALYTSGGYNVKNQNEETPSGRYESGSSDQTVEQDRPSRQQTMNRVIAEWQDQTTQNNGTGGIFTVPRKGTMVWIFFDCGDHNRPQYFGAAPRKLDWDTQFQKLSADVQDKEQTLNDILDSIEELQSDNQNFQGQRQIAQKVQIKTPIIKPDLSFDADNFTSNTKNKDLTSWTSPGGVTFLAVNESEGGSNEKIYIMHKGYVEYVDDRGQRTVLVGKTNLDSTDPLSPQHSEGEGNDARQITANNHELFVLGDFKLYVKNNCFVQCEKSVQINAKEEVGVFAREGNINILAEMADVNVEAKSANFNVSATNSQFETEGKFLVKSSGEMKFQSDEAITFKAPLIQSNATEQYTVDSPDFIVKSSDNTTVQLNNDGAFIDVSSGEVGISTGDFKISAQSGIEINTDSYNIRATSEYNAEVNQKFSLRANETAFDSAISFSANSQSVKMLGTTASYGAGSRCFVGGSTTEVGGTVSLGQGAAEQPDQVTQPNVSQPTTPGQPEDVQDLEFEDVAEAKDISATESNFSSEEA